MTEPWWAGVKPGNVGAAVYLGPKGRGKTTGMLKITDDGIQWRGGFSKVMIPWAEIDGIDIDGETTKRVTLGRALTIGVFALGAKKKGEDCHLTIVTATAEYGFVLHKTPSIGVRNAMRPILTGLAGRAE